MEHFDWIKGFVFPYINFALFLALIYLFARPAISKGLQDKRDAFAKLLGESQRAREQAEVQQQILQRKLQSLDNEIAQIVSNAKQAAQAEAAQILANAEQVSAHIRSEARNAAKAELDEARAQLNAEIMAAVRSHVEDQIKTASASGKQQELLQQQLSFVKSSGFDMRS